MLSYVFFQNFGSVDLSRFWKYQICRLLLILGKQFLWSLPEIDFVSVSSKKKLSPSKNRRFVSVSSKKSVCVCENRTLQEEVKPK